MRCAQRGCALPHNATTTEGALCPVCNNPLIVVMEEGDAERIADEKRRADELEALRLAALASSDPVGHQQAATDAAAEVSQEKPPVIGEDGPLLAVAE